MLEARNLELETQMAIWIKSGFVIDKLTGFYRRPTETEVSIMKGEERRKKLRATELIPDA